MNFRWDNAVNWIMLFRAHRMAVFRTFLVTVTCAWSMIAFSQTSLDNTLLWEIVHPATRQSSFLFATVHRSDSIVLQVDAKILSAIKRTDVLALESDPSRWQASLTRSPLETYFLPSNKGMTLPDLQPAHFQLPDYRSAIRQALTQAPVFATNWLRYQPGNSTPILDLLLYQLAERIQKPIVELETDEDRAAAFDLEMTTAKNHHTPPTTERQGLSSNSWDRAYEQGNIIGFEQASATQTSLYDQRVLAKRNELLAANITQLLQSKTACIAIGAAHIPGEMGLLARLEKAGFKVTALPFHRQLSLTQLIQTIPAVQQADSTYTYYPDQLEVRTPNRMYDAKTFPHYPLKQYTDIASGEIYVGGRIATAAHFRGYTMADVMAQVKQEVQQVPHLQIVYTSDTLVHQQSALRLITRDIHGLWQDRLLVLDKDHCWIIGWNGSDALRKHADQFLSSLVLPPIRNAKERFNIYDASHQSGEVVIMHRNHVDSNGTQTWSMSMTLPPHTRLDRDSIQLQLTERAWRKGFDIAEAGTNQWSEYFHHPVLENEYLTKTGQRWHVRFLRTGPTIWTWINSSSDSTGFKTFEGFPWAMSMSPNVLKLQTDTTLGFQMRLMDSISTAALDIEAKQKINLGGAVYRRYKQMAHQQIQLQVFPLDDYQTWADSSSFLRDELEVWKATPSHQVQVLESTSFPKQHQWKIRMLITQHGTSQVIRHTTWLSGRRIYRISVNYDPLLREETALWASFESFQPIPVADHITSVIDQAHPTFWNEFLGSNTPKNERLLALLQQIQFHPGDIPFLERAWNQSRQTEGSIRIREMLIHSLARIQIRDEQSVSLFAKWYHQIKTIEPLRSAILLELARLATSSASAMLWKLDSSLYPRLSGSYAMIDWENFLQDGAAHRTRYIPQLLQDIQNTGGRNASWNLLYKLHHANQLQKHTYATLEKAIQTRLDSLWKLVQTQWNPQRTSASKTVSILLRHGLPDLVHLLACSPNAELFMDRWMKDKSKQEAWWVQVYFWSARWKQNKQIDPAQWNLLLQFDAGRLILEEETSWKQTAQSAPNEAMQKEQLIWLIQTCLTSNQAHQISWLQDTVISTAHGWEKWHVFRVFSTKTKEATIAITTYWKEKIDWSDPQVHFAPEPYLTEPNLWEATWNRIAGRRQPFLRNYLDPASFRLPLWLH